MRNLNKILDVLIGLLVVHVALVQMSNASELQKRSNQLEKKAEEQEIIWNKRNDEARKKVNEMEAKFKRLKNQNDWHVIFKKGFKAVIESKKLGLSHPIQVLGPDVRYVGEELEASNIIRLVYYAGSAGTSSITIEFRFIRFNLENSTFLGDFEYLTYNAIGSGIWIYSIYKVK